MQFQKLTLKNWVKQPMKFFEWQLVRSRACCKFKGCVGQVDAEKLAQWSSVAAWVLSCGSEWAWCHLNSPRCFSFDWLPF